MLPLTLPADLAQFVHDALAAGRYQTEADVICEGLRLLQEREMRLRALRKDVAEALEQLDRGEGVPMDAQAVKARGRLRLAEQNEAP